MTTSGVFQAAAKQGHMRCSKHLKVVLKRVKSKDLPGAPITKRKITLDTGHIVWAVFEQMWKNQHTSKLPPDEFNRQLRIFVMISIHSVCSLYAAEFDEPIYFDIVWDHPDLRPVTKETTLEERLESELDKLVKRLINTSETEAKRTKTAELKREKRERREKAKTDKSERENGGDAKMKTEDGGVADGERNHEDVGEPMEEDSNEDDGQEGPARTEGEPDAAPITLGEVVWPQAPKTVDYDDSFERSFQYQGFDPAHLRHLQARTEADTCLALSAVIISIPGNLEPDPYESRSRIEYISYNPALTPTERSQFLCPSTESYLICHDSDFSTVSDPQHFRWVINQAPLGTETRDKYSLDSSDPLPPPLTSKASSQKEVKMVMVYRVWDFDGLAKDQKVFVSGNQLGRAGEAVFYGNDHSKGAKGTGRVTMAKAQNTALVAYFSSPVEMKVFDDASADGKERLEENWRRLVSSLPQDPTLEELSLAVFRVRQRASFGLAAGSTLSKSQHRVDFLAASEQKVRNEIANEKLIVNHQTSRGRFQDPQPRNHPFLSTKFAPESDSMEVEKPALSHEERNAHNKTNRHLPISVKKLPTFGKELEVSLGKIAPAAILEKLLSPPKRPDLPAADAQTFKDLGVEMKTLSLPLKTAFRAHVPIDTTFASRNLLVAIHEAAVFECAAIARVAASSLRLIGTKNARIFLACGTSFLDIGNMLHSVATQMSHSGQGTAPGASASPLECIRYEASQADTQINGEVYSTLAAAARLYPSLTPCASAFATHLKENLTPRALSLIPLLSNLLQDHLEILQRLVNLSRGLFPNLDVEGALPTEPTSVEMYLLSLVGNSRNPEVQLLLSRFAAWVLNVETSPWQQDLRSLPRVNYSEDREALEQLQLEFQRLLSSIYRQPGNFDVNSDLIENNSFDDKISAEDIKEASKTFAKTATFLRKILSVVFVEMAMHGVEGADRLILPQARAPSRSTRSSTRNAGVGAAPVGQRAQGHVNKVFGEDVKLADALASKPRTGAGNAEYVWKVRNAFVWCLLYISESIHINFDPQSMQFTGATLTQIVEPGQWDRGTPPALSCLRDLSRNLETQRRRLEDARRAAAAGQNQSYEVLKPVEAPVRPQYSDYHHSANVAQRRINEQLASVDKLLQGRGFKDLENALPESRIAHTRRAFPDKIFFEPLAAIRYFLVSSTQAPDASTLKFDLLEGLVQRDCATLSASISARFGGAGMTKTNRLSLIGNTPHEALWFLFKCHRPQSLIPHHFCVSRHEVKITYYNPRVCPRKITGQYVNDIDFTESLVPRRADYDNIFPDASQQHGRSSRPGARILEPIPTFFRFTLGQRRAEWVAARSMSLAEQQRRSLPQPTSPTSIIPLDFEFVDPDRLQHPKLFDSLKEKHEFDALQRYNNDLFRFHMNSSNLKDGQRLVVITNDKGDVNPAVAVAYFPDTKESVAISLGRGRFVGDQVSDEKVRNSLIDSTGRVLLGQFFGELGAIETGSLSQRQIESFNSLYPDSTVNPRLGSTSRIITDYTQTRKNDHDGKLRADVSQTLKAVLKLDKNTEKPAYKIVYVEGLEKLPANSTGRHGPRKSEGVSKVILEEIDKLRGSELHAFGLREDDTSQTCSICGIYGLVYPHRTTNGTAIGRVCFHPECQNFQNRDLNSARIQNIGAHATALTAIYALSPFHQSPVFGKEVPRRSDGKRLRPKSKRQRTNLGNRLALDHLKNQDAAYGLPEGISRRDQSLVLKAGEAESRREEERARNVRRSKEDSSRSDVSDTDVEKGSESSEEDASGSEAATGQENYEELEQDDSILAHLFPPFHKDDLPNEPPMVMPSSINESAFPTNTGFKLLF